MSRLGAEMKADNSNTGKYPSPKTQPGDSGGAACPWSVSHSNFYFIYFISPRAVCEEHPSPHPIVDVAPGTFKNIFMGGFQLIPRSFYKNGTRFLRNNVAESQEPWFASLGQVPVTTGPWFGGTGQCLVYGCTQ